jgi:hypothetical protein
MKNGLGVKRLRVEFIRKKFKSIIGEPHPTNRDFLHCTNFEQTLTR